MISKTVSLAPIVRGTDWTVRHQRQAAAAKPLSLFVSLSVKVPRKRRSWQRNPVDPSLLLLLWVIRRRRSTTADVTLSHYVSVCPCHKTALAQAPNYATQRLLNTPPSRTPCVSYMNPVLRCKLSTKNTRSVKQNKKLCRNRFIRAYVPASDG